MRGQKRTLEVLLLSVISVLFVILFVPQFPLYAKEFPSQDSIFEGSSTQRSPSEEGSLKGSQANILTLDKAIDEGLTRSPQIQKSRAIAQEYRWKRIESLGSGFLPKLSAAGAHYFSPQYTITGFNFAGQTLNFPGFYPNTTFSLDLTIPIFDGLANIRNLQGAGLAEDAVQKELSRAEFQLKKDIELAFYQALAAAQLDMVAEENVKTMDDHLRQVSVQNKGGAATRYDVLRVEVQLNDARADSIDAKDNVTLTRRKLNQLLNLESDDRSLQGTLPVPDVQKVKDLRFDHIAEVRDDIQALNLRAEAAGHFHSAQNAWLSPTISVGGQYLFYDQQLFNNTVQNTGNYKTAYNVGVFLKWNLFDGGVSLARANEIAYQEIQASKTAETAKIAVPYDFDYWKRRYISNSDHFLSKKLDITRSEESVRLSKEEERAGTRTSTETLDAELDLFRAKAGAVTAQVNAVEAQIHLELVLGKNI